MAMNPYDWTLIMVTALQPVVSKLKVELSMYQASFVFAVKLLV